MEAVYRFALHLAGNVSGAEDILQETFVRAYRSWETYTPKTNCRSWLFTICRREFLRTRDAEARHPEIVESDLDAGTETLAAATLFDAIASADPEGRFFESLIDPDVTRALAALPPEFREAVILSDMEGLSYPEISAVLGVPLGTVKSRLYRGRRLLEQALYDYALEMGYIRRGFQT